MNEVGGDGRFAVGASTIDVLHECSASPQSLMRVLACGTAVQAALGPES